MLRDRDFENEIGLELDVDEALRFESIGDHQDYIVD